MFTALGTFGLGSTAAGVYLLGTKKPDAVSLGLLGAGAAMLYAAAQKPASTITVVGAAPNESLHSHVCPMCDHEWWHQNVGLMTHTSEHTCPNCGDVSQVSMAPIHRYAVGGGCKNTLDPCLKPSSVKYLPLVVGGAALGIGALMLYRMAS
jgi:predicted RNA-binding Zn-ribbon protein involved in translation (DUF1610 family)